MSDESRCHVHVRIPGTKVGTDAYPACARMVQLASDLATPPNVRTQAARVASRSSHARKRTAEQQPFGMPRAEYGGRR